ncbi:uncharacterized protein LOC134528085 [Bacillus rossius redtenbacheri]|uniref:uncharacterized protein LOC134528085 n=1 Tax=Bacillus rossius redtenbacheri TaxID=93214 RepID=UPI002FDECF94
MARQVGASLLLLLFAVLHAGSALHCFESTCLSSGNINNCINTNRTVQKECNSAVLTQNVNTLRSSGGTPYPIPPATNQWTCIKHVLTGMSHNQPATAEVKMCFPDVPNACDAVTGLAKGLEVQLMPQQPGQVKTMCEACNGDSCNPASRPAASSLSAALAAAALLLLLPLRH